MHKNGSYSNNCCTEPFLHVDLSYLLYTMINVQYINSSQIHTKSTSDLGFRHIFVCSPFAMCVVASALGGNTPADMVWVRKAYSPSKILLYSSKSQTDGRTDGQMNRWTTCGSNIALCVASRGKKTGAIDCFK